MKEDQAMKALHTRAPVKRTSATLWWQHESRPGMRSGLCEHDFAGKNGSRSRQDARRLMGQWQTMHIAK